MKNKGARIDTYSTQYDIDFVVANSKVTLEELRELYYYADEEELDDTWDNGGATTCLLKRKSDNTVVVLIRYMGRSQYKSSGDKLLDIVNVASHEATHVAIDIYNSVCATIDVENQETFAYFVGYITERILKTLLNK
jgi:hypothetical protein